MDKRKRGAQGSPADRRKKFLELLKAPPPGGSEDQGSEEALQAGRIAAAVEEEPAVPVIEEPAVEEVPVAIAVEEPAVPEEAVAEAAEEPAVEEVPVAVAVEEPPVAEEAVAANHLLDQPNRLHVEEPPVAEEAVAEAAEEPAVEEVPVAVAVEEPAVAEEAVAEAAEEPVLEEVPVAIAVEEPAVPEEAVAEAAEEPVLEEVPVAVAVEEPPVPVIEEPAVEEIPVSVAIEESAVAEEAVAEELVSEEVQASAVLEEPFMEPVPAAQVEAPTESPLPEVAHPAVIAQVSYECDTDPAPRKVLNFTILVENRSGYPINGLVLRNAIPASTSYLPESTIMDSHPVSDVKGLTPLSSHKGLALGEIPPGEIRTVGFSLIVNSSLQDGSHIESNALLFRGDERWFFVDTVIVVRAEASFCVPEENFLSISPVDEANPAEVLTLTVTMKNSGNAPAHHCFLRSAIPGNTEYIPNSTTWEGSVLADREGACPLTAGEGLYLGDLKPGVMVKVRLKVRAAIPLPNRTPITFSASLRSGDDDLFAFPPAGTVIKSAPDFSSAALVASPEGAVSPGDEIRYTLTFANRGNETARRFAAAAKLSPHLSYIPGTTFIGEESLPDVDGSSILMRGAGFTLDEVGVHAPEDAPSRISFSAKVVFPLDKGIEIVSSVIYSCEGIDPAETAPAVNRVVSAPDFSMPGYNALRTEPSGQVCPDQVIPCTLSFRNMGNSRATAVQLRVPLPSYVTYMAGTTFLDEREVEDISGLSPLVTEAGLYIDEVDAGQGGLIRFKVKVQTPLSRGTRIALRGHIACRETIAVSTETVDLEVISAPDFSYEKENFLEVSPEDGITPGQTLWFTVHFRNTGNSDATGVTLRADVPDELLYQLSTTKIKDAPVPDAGGLSPLFTPHGLKVGDLPVGRESRVSYAMIVKRPLPNNTQIPHKVYIGSDQSSPTATNTKVLIIQSVPDFSREEFNRLEVYPKGPVSPGQVITYSLDYMNTGDAEAGRVVIRMDPLLLEYASYVRNSTMVNGTAVADVRGTSPLFFPKGLPVGRVGVDGGGRVTFEMKLRSPLDNRALAEAVGFIESELTSPVPTNRVTSRVVSRPDFSDVALNYLTTEPPDVVNPRDTITCVLHLRNTGDSNAYAAVLKAALPSHTTYKPKSTTLNGQPVADKAGTSPLFSDRGLALGSVEVGSPGKAVYQVVVDCPLDAGTEIQHRITISADDMEPFNVPPVANRVESLASFSDSRFNYLKALPAREVSPGDVIMYAIHYRNTGNANSECLFVRSGLPSHTRYVPGTTILNGEAVEDVAQGSPVFTARGLSVGKVDAGGEGEVSFQVTTDYPLDNGTQIVNRATLLPDQGPAVNTDMYLNVVLSRVVFAGEETTIRPSVEEVAPGDMITYFLRWRNTGNMDARNTVLRVELPVGLTYVPHRTVLGGLPVPDVKGASPLAALGGLQVGTVKAGEGRAASFTVVADKELKDGWQVACRMVIGSDEVPPEMITSAPVLVKAPPDFSNSSFNNMEVYPEGDVAPEEILTYTINYGNTGNAAAQDLIIRSSLPDYCQYLPGSTILNNYPVEDTNGTSALFTGRGLSAGRVTPGFYGNVMFQVRVSPDVESGARIIASSTLTCGKYSFGTNTVLSNLSYQCDFSNEKFNFLQVFPKGDVRPGTLLSYSIHYRNGGNAPARGVRLRVFVSPRTTYIPNSTRFNGKPVPDVDGLSPLLAGDGLAAGEVKPGAGGDVAFRVLVNTPLETGTIVTCQAALESQNAPVFSFNTLESRVESRALFTDPAGNFIESMPVGRIPIGTVCTFVVYFQNMGDSNANNVIARSEMPSGTAYVPGSMRLNGIEVADIDGGSPLFDPEGLGLGRLEVGQPGNISFQVKVKPSAFEGAPVVLKVTIASDQSSPAVLVAQPLTVTTAGAIYDMPASDEPALVDITALDEIALVDMPDEPDAEAALSGAEHRVQSGAPEPSLVEVEAWAADEGPRDGQAVGDLPESPEIVDAPSLSDRDNEDIDEIARACGGKAEDQEIVEAPLHLFANLNKTAVGNLNRFLREDTSMGMLRHFLAVQVLMGKKVFGSYTSEGAPEVADVVNDLSRKLFLYSKSQENLLKDLQKRAKNGEEAYIEDIDRSDLVESLKEILDLFGRFFALQNEHRLSFAAEDESGRSGLVLRLSFGSDAFRQMKEVVEASLTQGLLPHLFFVQWLMGDTVEGRDLKELEELLREYSSSLKTVLNKYFVSVRLKKKIDYRAVSRNHDALLEDIAGRLSSLLGQ
jgi:uncharacterized repeat protein (TIGR01451 family)